MQARRPLVTAILIVSILRFAGPAAARPDGPSRCRMLKLGAIATHAHAQLRCHLRALGFGMSVVPACLASADAKLARSIAHADQVGGCPPDRATAQDASAAFVARALALVQPPPSPTPTPMPTPSPAFTGCGNDVVEPGEQCDGQAFCTTACQFSLPTVCCGQSGFCIEGEFPFLAETCFANEVPYVLGAVCAPDDLSCTPESGCTGSCEPETTFPATHLCCAAPSGCTEAVVADTVELWQFFLQGCLQASGSFVVGTCAQGDTCTPGG